MLEISVITASCESILYHILPLRSSTSMLECVMILSGMAFGLIQQPFLPNVQPTFYTWSLFRGFLS